MNMAIVPKTYLFEYRYHHQESIVEIHAEDLEDAHRRLLAIRQHAHFKSIKIESPPDGPPPPTINTGLSPEPLQELTWLGKLFYRLGWISK